MKTRVCFLGSTRYGLPPTATVEAKFRLLGSIAESWVVGFSTTARPSRWTGYAHFRLLPCPPWPLLRQVAFFALAPLVTLWIVMRHRVEVIVAQSPYEGAAAAVVKRLAGVLGRPIKLVIESHGDFEVSLFLQRRVPFRRAYRWAMSRATAFAARHADALRAVSRSTRVQLEARMPGRPMVEFTTWTDIERFTTGDACPRSATPLIVFAGTLIPRKGVHHLLDAFARIAATVPSAQLALIGGSPNPAYEAALREQVRSLQLHERVRFESHVEPAELAQWMRRAWVLVLPALSEGLPRVIIEAMAAGTAVVATRVSGIPEIVVDGVTGWLVSPEDPSELAAALADALADPAATFERGERARALIRGRCTPDAYLQGYRTLLAAARGGGVVERWDAAAAL